MPRAALSKSAEFDAHAQIELRRMSKQENLSIGPAEPSVLIDQRSLRPEEQEIVATLEAASAETGYFHVFSHSPGKAESHGNLQQADLFLSFPSQVEQGLTPLIQAALAGCVLIVPELTATKRLFVPFNPLSEQGNAFLYPQAGLWHIVTEIIRARENYHFPFDWETLVRNSYENVQT